MTQSSTSLTLFKRHAKAGRAGIACVSLCRIHSGIGVWLNLKEGIITALDINEDNLKHGLLGLVMALVEIIRDSLKHQARERIKSGVLTSAEIERLGSALMELDTAIENIKEEQGITESVKGVRDGLDEIVDSVVDRLINPERWEEDVEK